MICICQLSHLLRGWHLIQKEGHPHLLISLNENLEDAILCSLYYLDALGEDRLPTLSELVEELADKAEDEG